MIDTLFACFVILIGAFYTFFQDIGLYWQLCFIPLVLLLHKKQVGINKLDLILLTIITSGLLYYIITGNRFYINISVGTSISLLISKLDIEYKHVFRLLIVSLIFNIAVITILALNGEDERVNSNDNWIIYTLIFDSLNKTYQVNNSAFFLLIGYLYYSSIKSTATLPISLFILLHTSRIIIFAIIIKELINHKNRINVFIALSLMLLFLIAIFDYSFIDYYFLTNDTSIIDRTDRFSVYLHRAITVNMLFIPQTEVEYALHNWILEVIYYFGILGIIYFLSQIYYSNQKVLLVLFFIAASGPKTCQDLLLYYFMLGYFLKYNNLKNLKTLKIGFP